MVALRKIAKDPKATVTQRLRACELQAIIAGYIAGQSQSTSTGREDSNGTANERRPSFANIRRLKELQRNSEQKVTKDYRERERRSTTKIKLTSAEYAISDSPRSSINLASYIRFAFVKLGSDVPVVCKNFRAQIISILNLSVGANRC